MARGICSPQLGAVALLVAALAACHHAGLSSVAVAEARPTLLPASEMQGIFLRSWSPLAARSAGKASPVERDFALVSERARAGRFVEARTLLDRLDASPDPRVRIESALFRVYLEDFDLALVGGGRLSGGTAAVDDTQLDAYKLRMQTRIAAMIATLPEADRALATGASRLPTLMWWEEGYASLVGFHADRDAIETTPQSAHREQEALATVGGFVREAALIDGPDARILDGATRAGVELAAGDRAGGVEELSKWLGSTGDPCVKAELHLRSGDADAAPFGPVELLGLNPLSTGTAWITLRATFSTRSTFAGAGPSARERAASEYALAAGCDPMGLEWRLRERAAFLVAWTEPRRAATLYDTAARKAEEQGATRDAERMHCIAALLLADESRLADTARYWTRSDDVGGRRSVLHMARRYALWLQWMGGDPVSARTILEVFCQAWMASPHKDEAVDLLLAMDAVYEQVGRLDAATGADEQAVASQQGLLERIRGLPRGTAMAPDLEKSAKSSLSQILARLVLRLSLLRIDDDSEALKARHDRWKEELRKQAGDATVDMVLRQEDENARIAELRRQVQTVPTCAGRAAVLEARLKSASTDLDRAELRVKLASCRSDWLDRARALLPRIDPLGPLEAALEARDPHLGFQSVNAVDSAMIDLKRAFRVAATSRGWSMLAGWAARLEKLVNGDPSLAGFRSYASFQRSLAQLHMGFPEDALRGLEALVSTGTVAADSELNVPVYRTLSEAYRLRNDPVRSLWAEAMRRVASRENDELDDGVRADDPASARIAALERKHALEGALDSSSMDLLDELRRSSRAAPAEAPRYPSVSDIASLLGRIGDATLVEVFDLTGPDTLVWCGRRGGLRALSLPQGSDYWAQQMRLYWDQLSRDDPSEAGDRLQRGRGLFRGFVDACGLAEGESLILVGVNAPLDHAIEPRGEVIERRTVVRAGELWEPPAPAPNEGGAFVLGANGGRLHEAESEAREVARILGISPWRDAQPSPEMWRSMETAEYVHIAADGDFRSENSYEWFLNLGASAGIQAWQLFGHVARVRLLTLSACETGALPASGSRGVRGRVRGHALAALALRAGASWVLASQWSADDQATSAFMTDFYRVAVQERAPLPAAFRAAARKIKADHEGHPEVYAPFTLSARSVAVAL
jgi:hypothetical protein